jgi:hypothetical protein
MYNDPDLVQDYRKIVRENIIDLKKQYAALIYNRDKIKEIDDNELQLTINVQLFLKMLLLEIRGKTISFASYCCILFFQINDFFPLQFCCSPFRIIVSC